MEWLNIHLSTLRSTEYLGSEPTERATWLCLLAFCVDQENGGVITGCGTWGDRKWMQLTGVTAKESRHPSVLWQWDGDNVIVFAYPTESEEKVKRLRRQGRAAADKRWGNKEPNAIPIAIPNAVGNGLGNAKGKGNSKGNSKERGSASAYPAFLKLVSGEWPLSGVPPVSMIVAKLKSAGISDADAALGLRYYIDNPDCRPYHNIHKTSFIHEAIIGLCERAKATKPRTTPEERNYGLH